MSLTDIKQLLPKDVYDAAVGASSPSAANVFVTTSDLGSSKAFQTLSSGLVGWDVTNGVNAEVTLTGPSILSVTNAQDGDYGTLIVRQDGVGGHTLGLPVNFKVVNGGGGAITLSTGPNEEDVLSWVYDGTDFYVSFGLNFT